MIPRNKICITCKRKGLESEIKNRMELTVELFLEQDGFVSLNNSIIPITLFYPKCESS